MGVVPMGALPDQAPGVVTNMGRLKGVPKNLVTLLNAMMLILTSNKGFGRPATSPQITASWLGLDKNGGRTFRIELSVVDSKGNSIIRELKEFGQMAAAVSQAEGKNLLLGLGKNFVAPPSFTTKPEGTGVVVVLEATTKDGVGRNPATGKYYYEELEAAA